MTYPLMIAGALVATLLSLYCVVQAVAKMRYVYLLLVPTVWLLYYNIAEVAAPGRLGQVWAATKSWLADLGEPSPTATLAISLSITSLALVIALTSSSSRR